MAFEEYRPQRVSTKDPAITINKIGLLTFNASCMQEYVGEKLYAKLYYDADAKVLGIKLLDKNEANSLPIHHGKNDAKRKRSQATLFVKSFITQCKLQKEPTTWNALPCEMNDNLGMLTVRLPVM